MAYDLSLYNAFGSSQPNSNWQSYMPASQIQPVNGLVKIDSIEGGRMYYLPPNSVSPPLFLSDENAFLIKTTDGGGAATLKKYTFAEAELEPENTERFVTRDYFDDWANRIMEAINGKHPVPEQQQGQSAPQQDQPDPAKRSV